MECCTKEAQLVTSDQCAHKFVRLLVWCCSNRVVQKDEVMGCLYVMCPKDRPFLVSTDATYIVEISY